MENKLSQHLPTPDEEGSPDGLTAIQLDSFGEEAELLAWLCEKIAYLMEYNMELLLSSLYRLDIDEAKINAALQPDAPAIASVGLAQLVMKRQQQRILTRNKYKPPVIDDPEWSL